jgi:hypothetical protein
MEFVPQVIETITHRHPAKFAAGPRIERTDIVQIDASGTTMRVDYWYENGRLVRVS